MCLTKRFADDRSLSPKTGRMVTFDFTQKSFHLSFSLFTRFVNALRPLSAALHWLQCNLNHPSHESESVSHSNFPYPLCTAFSRRLYILSFFALSRSATDRCSVTPNKPNAFFCFSKIVCAMCIFHGAITKVCPQKPSWHTHHLDSCRSNTQRLTEIAFWKLSPIVRLNVCSKQKKRLRLHLRGLQDF